MSTTTTPIRKAISTRSGLKSSIASIICLLDVPVSSASALTFAPIFWSRLSRLGNGGCTESQPNCPISD